MKKRESTFRFVKLSVILTLLVCLISLFAIASYASEDINPRVAIITETGCAVPGGETTVIVCIKNNPGIASATIKLTCDENLSLIAIEEGDALAALDFTPPGKGTETTAYTLPCQFVWDTVSNESVVNGTLLKLTFKVSATATAGTLCAVTLSCDSGDIVNGNIKTVEADITN